MSYQPKGLEFFDARSNRHLLLVQEGEWKGWLFYRHSDLTWVSVRPATEEDLHAIGKALALPIEQVDPFAQDRVLQFPNHKDYVAALHSDDLSVVRTMTLQDHSDHIKHWVRTGQVSPPPTYTMEGR